MHTPRILFPASLLVCALSWSVQSRAADHLWSADNLTKVLRDAAPPDRSEAVRLDGARGEVASGQAVFRADTAVAALSAEVIDLGHANGQAAIAHDAVKLQWIRYIHWDRNSDVVPADRRVAQAPVALPDPFWEDATISVEANAAQPLWIEVTLPHDAVPGSYTGTLRVTADGRPLELPLEVHVWDFALPETPHLAIINWWSFPGRAFQDIEPYSERYWEHLARACRFLVAHRQTDVNASLNGLVRESGSESEGFEHNLDRLTRYAEVAFEAGIERIHLHSVAGRTANIVDPASRVKVYPSALRRLAALDRLIREREWAGRFLVSIVDEPFIHHEASYREAVDRVHAAAPSVRCIEAVEAVELGDLDIYVPKLNHLDLWYPRFAEKQAQGKELWFYTCCFPGGRYPNRFMDQPLIMTRVLHWLNYLYGLDGYLHWGLNQFGQGDPYSQESFRAPLPPGDAAIAYPGTQGFLGSLRFSAQRDGIEDFEYLWLLEDRLRAVKARYGDAAGWLDPRQRPLELCRRVIWSFHEYTRDADVLHATRKVIAEEIEALGSAPLLIVQTTPPEGSRVPEAAPRHILLRGLTTPGATITVNGEPVHNLEDSGYFAQYYFMPDERPTITVTAELEGASRTMTRTFIPIE